MKKVFILSDTRSIDFSKRGITDEKGEIIHPLTKLQYKVLEKLVDNNRHPISYDSIISYAWGITESSNPEQNVRDTINQLKQIDNGLLKPYITPKYRFGYKFECNHPQNENTASDTPRYPETREYAPPSHYIDRKEDVEFLLANAYTRESYRVHAIVGERGLGKTTLALSFANEAIKRKTFKHVIMVSYSGSLKDTVEHIDLDISESGGNIFAEKIMMLKMMKETLLIIDNYDNPDFKNELAGDEPAYLRLLDTGCSILITSTCDLSKCYCIDDHVTHLSPLPTESLVSLYFDIKGDQNDSKQDVTELIDKYLLGNTYLVALAAELAKQEWSAKSIIESIKSLKTDDTNIISAQKDGKRQDEKTILDHYCCVLDNNKIINPANLQDRIEVQEVLSVLAMLPISGINHKDLEEIACEYPARKTLKKVISRLKNHNLVFENDGRIYLQPVVKEYLVRNTIIFGKYIYFFISNLSKKLDIHSYSDSMLYWLGIAESTYAAMNDEYIQTNAVSRTLELGEKADIDRSFESLALSVLLCSRMIACYNAINLYGKAYEYARLALPGLKNAMHSQRQELDMEALASCCNAVGHALTLGSRSGTDQSMRAAFSCLQTAERLAESIDNSKLLTKTHGEFASYYLKLAEYETALDYHTKALSERMILAEQEPESEEIKRMIAFTYRGIATDHFYLSRRESKKKHLEQSYKYHILSVNIFEELYGIHRLETVTGLNRMIGTGINLINSLTESNEIVQIFGYSLEELCEYFYNYLSEMFVFYGKCTFALNYEIEDSLKKLSELSKLMIEEGIFSNAHAEINEKAVQTVRDLPLIGDEGLKLCTAVLATSSDRF